MPLSPESSIAMADGSYKKLRDVAKGDEVLSFDFVVLDFVPSKVVDVFMSDKCRIWRYNHDQGFLEATASQHVLHPCQNGKKRWLRTMRVCKKREPVIVRNQNGCPTLSYLTRAGMFHWNYTMDLILEHHDRAYVCDSVVVAAR